MYRQCIIQVVSEDEVIPNDKIADVGCRIVEQEQRRIDSYKKETTLSGLFKQKLKNNSTASQRMAKGDYYERLLFKPVVAKIIDRTNSIEICLHYEQARSDFVSGHFNNETTPFLLCQLVALCIHSTAGSKQDLTTMASQTGLPFIKLWNLMPISEYVPLSKHSRALTSTWQTEVRGSCVVLVVLLAAFRFNIWTCGLVYLEPL